MVSEVSETQNPLDLIQQLIEIGRDVVNRGLVVGSGGNISMLVPGEDAFLITETGAKLDKLKTTSFVKVNFAGKFSEKDNKPSSEFRVHLSAYLNRKDIKVCIHLHPQSSVLLASLGLKAKFITVDHAYYLRKVEYVPWIRPGTQEIADEVARLIRSCNVLVLENHGCVVVGPNADLAYSRALNLEEAAELTIRAKTLDLVTKEVPESYWRYLDENLL